MLIKEPLLEKMSTCHNNPEKPSTVKINERIPSGNSLFTHCLFDTTKNKLDKYRGTDCLEIFFEGFKRACKQIYKLWEKRNDSISKWRK